MKIKKTFFKNKNVFLKNVFEKHHFSFNVFSIRWEAIPISALQVIMALHVVERTGLPQEGGISSTDLFSEVLDETAPIMKIAQIYI